MQNKFLFSSGLKSYTLYTEYAMAKKAYTTGEIMRFIEHLRRMELLGTSDLEDPKVQGYMRALLDFEKKYDSGK